MRLLPRKRISALRIQNSNTTPACTSTTSTTKVQTVHRWKTSPPTMNARVPQTRTHTFSSSSHESISLSPVAVPPPPSWSVQDLRLEENNQAAASESEELTDEEFRNLARRCLIDLDMLPANEILALKKSVQGMMRCLSVVAKEQEGGGEPIHITQRSDKNVTAVNTEPNRNQATRTQDRTPVRADDHEYYHPPKLMQNDAEQVIQTMVQDGKLVQVNRQEEDSDDRRPQRYFSLHAKTLKQSSRRN